MLTLTQSRENPIFLSWFLSIEKLCIRPTFTRHDVRYSILVSYLLKFSKLQHSCSCIKTFNQFIQVFSLTATLFSKTVVDTNMLSHVRVAYFLLNLKCLRIRSDLVNTLRGLSQDDHDLPFPSDAFLNPYNSTQSTTIIDVIVGASSRFH